MDGSARVHYPLENHDRHSLMDGLVAATRIAAACGATQLGSSFASMGLRDIPAVLTTGTVEEIRESEQHRDDCVEELIADMVVRMMILFFLNCRFFVFSDFNFF